MKAKIILILVCSCLCFTTFGQSDRIQRISNLLESRVADLTGLDEYIETSVSGVDVAEYIRLIGGQYELNVNVSDSISGTVTNNFSDARVADVFVFLCREFDLEIIPLGNILNFQKYNPPLAPVEVIQYSPPSVMYDSLTTFVSLDLRSDSLEAVARQITLTTPSNIVIGEGLGGKEVSAFIQNRPLKDALDKLAYGNGLVLKEENGFFILEDDKKAAADSQKPQRTPPLQRRVPDGELIISSNKEDETVSVSCERVDIAYLIDEVSKQLDKNYFVYSRPEGTISLVVENAKYNDFLGYLFHGTNFSFIIENEVYLIGNAQDDQIRTIEMVQLQHRTIENVLGSFGGNRNSISNNSNQGPNSQRGAGIQSRGGGNGGNPFQSSNIGIQPFPELNSFIVTGTYPEVFAFKEFIRNVDQVVPVVMIEVLIVDVNKNLTIAAGVNAGIAENNAETSGTITGDGNNAGLNLNLSTDDINNLINSFNGFGVVNLGNVGPNFYLNIQALESNGVLRTRSTPKLATLNSYTASLSIGQEEYYLETSNVVTPGTNSTVVTEQQNWKSLNADLSIDITPIVSGEGQVTLAITVTQSDFTARSGENGPFGSVNREFSSSIRVMDGEMILLGGLEDKATGNSSSGLPGIARIPIIKWFFGKNSRTKQETRLNIFIKPTIMY